MDRRAALTLARLLPRLEARFVPTANPADWAAFIARLRANFDRLFAALLHLYGDQYDFYYHLESILALAARSWLDRPEALKALDAAREANPTWFQSERMIGGVCYIDRFADDLAGVRARIPYFKELGLTYLHLMPPFRAPAGNNDGGYAVSSYREVDPALGTMAELAALATELRDAGISLVLDFVFNHTADEHDWAVRARPGDPDYQDYYLLYPDRQLPDAYERTLREIFPDQRPGNFTWRPDLARWVWTTFNSFQWDLNYANPVVFERMAGEMLFLANQGAELLRLDAVVFIWKRLGTGCENLPESHLIVRAFNALARIAAPALLFKSEAIVHPDDVAEFISPDECQTSYNPLQMALLWNTLATRDVRLLRDSLRARLRIDPRCAWVNYVRSHDDIGWTFDDGDAGRLGINGHDHRRFLNNFYTGRFPGSFARGVPFQENPRTGDARISGTTASLAGLEAARRAGDLVAGDLAIQRILLLYGITLATGGIPLLYLGDELGQENDYDYGHTPAHGDDSRWLHRPAFDWAQADERGDATTIGGHIFAQLRHLIAVRKAHPVFGGVATAVFDSGNDHVFGFVRRQGEERLVVLANFTERPQTITANLIRLYGLAYTFRELIGDTPIDLAGDLTLSPYQVVWLAPE